MVKFAIGSERRRIRTVAARRDASDVRLGSSLKDGKEWKCSDNAE